MPPSTELQPGPLWALPWAHLTQHQLRLWFLLFLQRGTDPALPINLPLPNSVYVYLNITKTRLPLFPSLLEFHPCFLWSEIHSSPSTAFEKHGRNSNNKYSRVTQATKLTVTASCTPQPTGSDMLHRPVSQIQWYFYYRSYCPFAIDKRLYPKRMLKTI